MNLKAWFLVIRNNYLLQTSDWNVSVSINGKSLIYVHMFAHEECCAPTSELKE